MTDTPNWTGPLGDALAVLIDHRGKTPRKLGGDWADDGGVPVYSAVHLKNGRLQPGNARRVSWDLYQRWMPVPLQAGDVLLTSEAPLGEVAYLSKTEPACLGQRLFGLRGRPDVLYGRYLFYLLQHAPVRAKLLARASGTTVSGIRQAELVRVPLELPAIATQQKTASILAAYDELIENNLRRIEILEEMAQAIYREWFVDFRYPGYDSDAVSTDGGSTPSGWDEVSLEQIVSPLRSHVDPSKHPDTEFIHYSFAAFDAGRVPSQDSGRDLKSGKLAVEQPSVLLAKLNPRIPRVWKVEPPSDVSAIASSEFLVLAPTDSVPLSYTYALVKDMSVSGRFAAMAGGTSTSHQRLRQRDLLSMNVALPSPTALKLFDDVVAPMLDLADRLIAMNENLRATRDLLLPKLVSGEIDVSDLDIDTSWLAA